MLVNAGVPLKTKRSRRVVTLPGVVADALAAHLSRFDAGDAGFIFAGETGKPYARETYSRSFARAVEEAGLPKGTTSHDLRHHYVSVLLDAGESVVTVAERIGDTPAMVLAVHGHMMPNTEERTRRAVDDAWRAPAHRVVPSTDPYGKASAHGR